MLTSLSDTGSQLADLKVIAFVPTRFCCRAPHTGAVDVLASKSAGARSSTLRCMLFPPEKRAQREHPAGRYTAAFLLADTVHGRAIVRLFTTLGW